jgi:hypothetical protein
VRGHKWGGERGIDSGHFDWVTLKGKRKYEGNIIVDC